MCIIYLLRKRGVTAMILQVKDYSLVSIIVDKTRASHGSKV